MSSSDIKAMEEVDEKQKKAEKVNPYTLKDEKGHYLDFNGTKIRSIRDVKGNLVDPGLGGGTDEIISAQLAALNPTAKNLVIGLSIGGGVLAVGIIVGVIAYFALRKHKK